MSSPLKRLVVEVHRRSLWQRLPGVKDSVAITQAASSPTESIRRSWKAGPCTLATEVDWMGTDP